MPPMDRWRCTWKLSEGLPGIECRLLDDLLEYFGIERRAVYKPHDAIDDRKYAAAVYMEIMKMPKATAKDFGFVNENEEN